MNRKGKPEAAGFRLMERLEETAPWKRGAVVVLFLLFLICLLLPELVFQNKIFLVPDTRAPISFASVGREALESGVYPLWNPYLFCGMPSFHSLAYAPYVYPVSFITHLLYRYLHVPEMTWLLAHYLLAGAAMYLLLRSLGTRAMVAMFGGALFMLLPNYIAMGANGHGSQACAVAYMPLALLFARRLQTGERRPATAAFLALTLGLQMLRGHVQISYYTFLLVGLIFVFESAYLLRAGEKSTLLRNGLFTAGAAAAAFGIAAVLILPVREYAAYSIRGGGGGGLDYGYATGWSLHPKEMLTFLFPWAFGFGKASYWGGMPFTDYPNYLGATIVLFSALALHLVRHRIKWFFLGTAVIATLIGFGRFWPALYDPMFRYFPFFDKFRVPVMILIVQQLSLVSLMGMGFEAFLRRYERGELPKALGSRSLRWALVFCAAALVVSLVAGGAIERNILQDALSTQKVQREWAEFGARMAASDLPLRFLLLFAAVLALLVGTARKTASGALALAIGTVALIEIWTVDLPVVHPERTWGVEDYRIIQGGDKRDEYMRPDAAVEFLASDESFYRIFPAPAAPPGRWSYSTPPFSENKFMISRIFSLGGYHAAKLKVYQEIIDVMFASFNRGVVPINILDMLNTKYILSYFKLFGDDSSFPLVFEKGGVFIYENPGALPRAALFDTYRVVERGRIPDLLLSREFDPGRELLLEREPGIVPGSIGGSSVEITDYRLNGIELEAHIEEPCLLLLSEIDYPSWRAEVDGEPVEILTADYCLRAIPLAPGSRKIEFRFSSGILRMSLVISIVTFVIVLAVPFVWRRAAAEKGR
ncbi:MAG TPA: hypothetical protein ENO08_04490 [Candidatus Eisenbacteria bacterium]|uniref:YfhO family protein n=1 Tax=Eiseniibacteriota bacterium TaxID=2212470 RepID=A0A7V2F3S9_UNCEI|nr:hypothetical protein [Candidatus Eisenbacteria bacterium]